jgi:hypothetical protein
MGVSHNSPLPSLLQPRAYLIPHDGLLYSREVLERGEQDVTALRTADVIDETPQFLAQRDQNLILILNGLCGR